MIPVRLAPEPADFKDKVFDPGMRALHERIGLDPPTPRTGGQPFDRAKKKSGELITRFEDLQPKHMPDYWREALDDLYAAYDRVCAYSAFYICPTTGWRTADHMAPKSVPGEGSGADEDPHMVPMSSIWDHVYAWSNYRLACGRLNARKSDYQDVLDPFEVGEDWFVMEFVGFQVRPAHRLPDEVKGRIWATIERLGLNERPIWPTRKDHYLEYRVGLPFELLKKHSPFVAREMTYHPNLLREEDKHHARPARPSDLPQDP